jgi:hypothetical protein
MKRDTDIIDTLHPDNGGRKNFRNVCQFGRDYTVKRITKQPSSMQRHLQEVNSECQNP